MAVTRFGKHEQWEEDNTRVLRLALVPGGRMAWCIVSPGCPFGSLKPVCRAETKMYDWGEGRLQTLLQELVVPHLSGAQGRRFLPDHSLRRLRSDLSQKKPVLLSPWADSAIRKVEAGM